MSIVICAPLGAILMNTLGTRLLSYDGDPTTPIKGKTADNEDAVGVASIIAIDKEDEGENGEERQPS